MIDKLKIAISVLTTQLKESKSTEDSIVYLQKFYMEMAKLKRESIPIDSRPAPEIVKSIEYNIIPPEYERSIPFNEVITNMDLGNHLVNITSATIHRNSEKEDLAKLGANILHTGLYHSWTRENGMYVEIPHFQVPMRRHSVDSLLKFDKWLRL